MPAGAECGHHPRRLRHCGDDSCSGREADSLRTLRRIVASPTRHLLVDYRLAGRRRLNTERSLIG
jgi:hypothetical protein